MPRSQHRTAIATAVTIAITAGIIAGLLTRHQHAVIVAATALTVLALAELCRRALHNPDTIPEYCGRHRAAEDVTA